MTTLNIMEIPTCLFILVQLTDPTFTKEKYQNIIIILVCPVPTHPDRACSLNTNSGQVLIGWELWV